VVPVVSGTGDSNSAFGMSFTHSTQLKQTFHISFCNGTSQSSNTTYQIFSSIFVLLLPIDAVPKIDDRDATFFLSIEPSTPIITTMATRSPHIPWLILYRIFSISFSQGGGVCVIFYFFGRDNDDDEAVVPTVEVASSSSSSRGADDGTNTPYVCFMARSRIPLGTRGRDCPIFFLRTM